MRTFIIRARKGTTRWEKIKSHIGTKEHIEIIAHSVINAFFISQGFRDDVEFYIILDSSEDFPHTIKLSSADGLSIKGFHEAVIIELLETILKQSQGLQKDETRHIAPGINISGFGFEVLLRNLLEDRTVYMLSPKGDDIRDIELATNPVFILTDHLPMPKNNIKSFKRLGLKMLSLGKKMLFASHCVVLINHEMDRNV